MTTDKIYLVGFMAAGKTTVARTRGAPGLAGRGHRRVDRSPRASGRGRHLREARRSVFPGRGTEILKLLLRSGVVVATGAFMDRNRAAISLDGLSVWLDLPFDVMLARLPPTDAAAAGSRADGQLFAVRQAAMPWRPLRVDAADAVARDRGTDLERRLSGDACAIDLSDIRQPQALTRARGAAARSWDRVLCLGDLVVAPSNEVIDRLRALDPLASFAATGKAACGIRRDQLPADRAIRGR